MASSPRDVTMSLSMTQNHALKPLPAGDSTDKVALFTPRLTREQLNAGQINRCFNDAFADQYSDHAEWPIAAVFPKRLGG